MDCRLSSVAEYAVLLWWMPSTWSSRSLSLDSGTGSALASGGCWTGRRSARWWGAASSGGRSTSRSSTGGHAGPSGSQTTSSLCLRCSAPRRVVAVLPLPRPRGGILRAQPALGLQGQAAGVRLPRPRPLPRIRSGSRWHLSAGAEGAGAEGLLTSSGAVGSTPTRATSSFLARTPSSRRSATRVIPGRTGSSGATAWCAPQPPRRIAD